MSTVSQEQARAIVADVRKKNGGISMKAKSFLAADSPEAQEVLQALQHRGMLAANSIATYCVSPW